MAVMTRQLILDDAQPWQAPLPALDSLEWRALAELRAQQYLHGGEPVTALQMAHILRVTERHVRIAVRNLRLAGHWIVPSGRGYRLSTDPDEVRALQRLMRSRISAEAEVMQALERSLERAA